MRIYFELSTPGLPSALRRAHRRSRKNATPTRSPPPAANHPSTPPLSSPPQNPQPLLCSRFRGSPPYHDREVHQARIRGNVPPTRGRTPKERNGSLFSPFYHVGVASLQRHGRSHLRPLRGQAKQSHLRSVRTKGDSSRTVSSNPSPSKCKILHFC